MLITKKMLLALTLIGALVGAGIGALVTRSASSENTQAANDTYQTAPTVNTSEQTPEQAAADTSSQYKTSAEQAAYRAGFNEGFDTCSAQVNNTSSRATTSQTRYRAPARRYSNTRRTYYDYGTQPRGRSFWQKHRDKLTLAIGTGAGAGVGALIGGKKGAGIGALAGLGGSALYTYKLRKRSPRRY